MILPVTKDRWTSTLSRSRESGLDRRQCLAEAVWREQGFPLVRVQHQDQPWWLLSPPNYAGITVLAITDVRRPRPELVTFIGWAAPSDLDLAGGRCIDGRWWRCIRHDDLRPLEELYGIRTPSSTPSNTGSARRT